MGAGEPNAIFYVQSSCVLRFWRMSLGLNGCFSGGDGVLLYAPRSFKPCGAPCAAAEVDSPVWASVCWESSAPKTEQGIAAMLFTKLLMLETSTAQGGGESFREKPAVGAADGATQNCQRRQVVVSASASVSLSCVIVS